MVNFDLGQALGILKPLAIFILAMTTYAVFVFKFYRFLAKRDIIKLDLHQYNNANHWAIEKLLAIFLYILEFLILMPIWIFFWFAILATLLSILSESQTIDAVLIIAMAVVGTIRIVSYYSEELSKDLAKMLPFALLAIFLIDSSGILTDRSLELAFSVKDKLSILIYYLIFIVLMEFALRMITAILGLTTSLEDNREED